VVAEVANQYAGRRELPPQAKVEPELGASRLHLRVAAPRQGDAFFRDRKPAVRRMCVRRSIDHLSAVRGHFPAQLQARLDARRAVITGRNDVRVQIDEAGHARTVPVRTRGYGRLGRPDCRSRSRTAARARTRAIDRAHSSPSRANWSAPSSVWNAQPPGRPMPMSA